VKTAAFVIGILKELYFTDKRIEEFQIHLFSGWNFLSILYIARAFDEACWFCDRNS
jgi:hypothetical protein